jgi:TetR/AcrR family tetracycline transcriptional repressor
LDVLKRVRSQALSREEILAAALRLLRRDGLSRLTMRAVASELGVTPMAVYHHIEDKDSLIRLAYDEISASASGTLHLDEDGWEASLRRYLMSVWERLAPYPGLDGYLMEQPNINVSPQIMRFGIQFFEDAGFAPAQAPLAWSFALTYIHGRISVDAHLRQSPDAAPLQGPGARDHLRYGVEAVLHGLRVLREDAQTTFHSTTGTARE